MRARHHANSFTRVTHRTLAEIMASPGRGLAQSQTTPQWLSQASEQVRPEAETESGCHPAGARAVTAQGRGPAWEQGQKEPVCPEHLPRPPPSHWSGAHRPAGGAGVCSGEGGGSPSSCPGAHRSPGPRTEGSAERPHRSVPGRSGSLTERPQDTLRVTRSVPSRFLPPAPAVEPGGQEGRVAQSSAASAAPSPGPASPRHSAWTSRTRDGDPQKCWLWTRVGGTPVTLRHLNAGCSPGGRS